MFPKTRSLALLFILSAIVSAQTTQEKNATEQADKVRKEAVAFLRETLSDVNGMRSLENRISFAAEIAGLMWFHDEREARAMYTGVIGDFRDLVAKYDHQMNEFGITLADEEPRGFISFMVEPTDKGRILRKFATAVGVRQQIALSIAEHDPDLAFGFYYDSLTSIANPELRTQVEGRDTHFEFQLLNQLAEKNAAKAAQFGLRSIDKGVTSQHIELLKKIYAKDPDRGVEFGAALLSRFKKQSGKELYILSSLIEFGGERLDASRKAGGKRPVYSQSELRELAEVLAQAILTRKDDEEGTALGYVGTVQKYLPGRAAQIRSKFKTTRTGDVDYSGSSNSMANAANVMSTSNSNVGSSAYEREMREREEQEKAERKLMEDVQSLGTKQLPKEEREKIVTQSRKIIMQTPGRDKKIMGLSMLASQVSKMGDKELAGEIMRDAERLVNPAPKTYQDFLLSWMLASGYAEADPDKAFPLLEETIGRANETLSAFIKVGEFIDVAEEMIQDGEVQVGVFGGQMIRGLTTELGMADATIQVLANADFTKTKNLTNRFERAEIRILAKMMVLRAVLSPKKAAKPDEVLDEPIEN
ncbi:MAG: hypothetical protein H0U23_09455 [Blastocatellia bacterium]|nr:hypothetical protein [Blastocatellia bacterium]